MPKWKQRPDLDLTDILPAYREFLRGSSTAEINYVMPKGERDYVPPRLWDDDIPDRLYADRRSVLDPMLLGSGPEACSTEREVATRAFAWDVNYYYRRLAIPFPYVHVTDGVLSRAYLAGDQHDPLAMYALTQLLNPVVRAEYDAMPLGSTYLNDEHVQQWMKARAAAQAGRRTAEGVFTEAQQVLDEWGYTLKPDPDQAIDNQANLVDDQAHHRQEPAFTQWGYSYWSWRSQAASDRQDALEVWQTLLVRALSEVGLRLGLAVGTMGSQPHPYVVSRPPPGSGSDWVVYLHQDMDPSPEMARNAAAALHGLVLQQNEHPHPDTPFDTPGETR